jgi:hypothetical protein
MDRYDYYRRYVLQNAPRLLSQLDRDKNSPTYGCFDRNHWHYKIQDFCSIVLQQGSLALTLLYSNNFEGNIYYQNPKIKEWILASLEYWGKKQLGDGSFDEYWPNEHGYPPTVFSLFAVSESAGTVMHHIPGDRVESLREQIRKSCAFISEHGEAGAQNQEIASIAALYSAYLVLGEEWISDLVDRKVTTILSRQSEEGWFFEYGGPDIGYLSVSLCYLAEYYRLSNDERVLPALQNIVDFAQYFIHPDGTAGGEYGSRNTEYFLAGGLEIVAPHYPPAGAVAEKLSTVLNESYRLPDSVDDRYLSHYFLHTYIRALLHCRPAENLPALPCDMEAHEKYFKDAKIFVKKNENYYAIFSLLKGVIKVYGRDTELLNDCGYLAELQGKSAVTNWINNNYHIRVDGSACRISGHFHVAPKQIAPSPLTHALLRGSSMVLGEGLNSFLRAQLITRDQAAPIYFERSVRFSEAVVTIEDVIKSGSTISKLSAVDAFSPRYVSSSKFFQSKEIGRADLPGEYKNIKEICITKEVDTVNRRYRVEYVVKE